MKVITFSRYYLKGHPRAGEPTHFVEKIVKGLINTTGELSPSIVSGKYKYDCNVLSSIEPKWHTFRKGYRWKEGEMFSARVWSGAPYKTKQVEICQIEIKEIIKITLFPKTKSLRFDTELFGYPTGWYAGLDTVTKLATNDGLAYNDFWDWFGSKNEGSISGQLICWNENVDYESIRR